MEEKGVLLILFTCGHLHEGVSLGQRSETSVKTRTKQQRQAVIRRYDSTLESAPGMIQPWHIGRYLA